MRLLQLLIRMRNQMQTKTKRCLDPDVHLPWGVDLLGLTREDIGDLEFEAALNGARHWCEASCQGRYTVHPIREDERGRLLGRRFEFDDQIDAAKFKLTWG